MLNKFTKNVATIGPATETPEIIKELIEAGMNMARFNTKHSSPEWHQEKIHIVRQVAEEMGQSIAIMLDLQGPEIRINLPNEKPFDLKTGETCIFTSNPHFSAEKMVVIPSNVVDTLTVGNIVLLDDGFCELEVTEAHPDHLVLTALGDCTVKHRKTMNIPGITVDMPSLVETDYAQLDAATNNNNIDFVGLSFVRNADDIAFLKQELANRKIDAQIIAKIENQAALDNLAEIIDASDAVMVARGDLGVEVPYEELVYWQRDIITRCRLQAKPVIVATQMLSSMVDHPRPTRAEVSDIAHAIYDGTSAVMLSEETTIGKYPVKAVRTQAAIATFNEEFACQPLCGLKLENNTEIITHAAIGILDQTNKDIAAIVCTTKTGYCPRLLARLRPKLPIYAVTDQEKTYRQLALAYGVEPLLMEETEFVYSVQIINLLKEKGILQSNQEILMVSGEMMKEGTTDSMTLIKVE